MPNMIPLTKKVETIHNQVNSAAHDLETVIAGLEEHQNSGNADDLQSVLHTALEDLKELYDQLKGEEHDQELSEAFDRAQLP